MNQSYDTRTSYDAPVLEAADPIYAMFELLNAENQIKAIQFVAALKASQYTPGP